MKKRITKKEFFKRLLLILLLILIILIIVFCVFNFKTIKNGRNVNEDDLISNTYQSTDESAYLYFISEDLVKIKFVTKEEMTFNSILQYELEDGYLSINSSILDEENPVLKFQLINVETIYFYSLNKYLYLS